MAGILLPECIKWGEEGAWGNMRFKESVRNSQFETDVIYMLAPSSTTMSL